MADQGHDKEHQENEKQNLRDSRGGRSDHAKSQQSGDHRDNEENERIIKHLPSSTPARRTSQTMSKTHFHAHHSSGPKSGPYAERSKWMRNDPHGFVVESPKLGGSWRTRAAANGVPLRA